MTFFKGLSRTTEVFGVSIVISALFTRQMADLLRYFIGLKNFNSFMFWGFLTFCLAALFKRIKKARNVFKVLFSAGLVGFTLVYLWKTSIPVERIHLVEFGFLGWLATRDLNKYRVSLKGVLLAFLFGVLIGVADECYQWFIPWRYFDLRDIFLDSLGTGLGVVFYLINRKPDASKKITPLVKPAKEAEEELTIV